MNKVEAIQQQRRDTVDEIKRLSDTKWSFPYLELAGGKTIRFDEDVDSGSLFLRIPARELSWDDILRLREFLSDALEPELGTLA